MTGWFFLVLTLLVFNYADVHAAALLTKVLVTTGSASEREGALYVAQDQGYFRKYGLDLTLVQVRNGPVGMSALSSGESSVALGFGVGSEPRARFPRAPIWFSSPASSID